MIVTHQQASARASVNKDAAREIREQIDKSPGGLDGFRQSIQFETIDNPASPALRDFHAVLASGIVPGLLVPIEDFASALGPKNADPAFQRMLGPYRYDCLVASTEQHGLIGAAGFVTFCHRQGPATLHTSYCAVLPAFRGLRLVRGVLEATTRIAIRFIEGARPAAFDAGPVVHFIETHDIGEMTLGDRLLEEAMAIHPLARDAMWERIGFREIAKACYRQRGDPPDPLTLRALLIQTVQPGGHARPLRLIPPESLPGGLVLRHVSAFDNLLLNYENASQALAAGHAFPDPRDAGLLEPKMTPEAVLSVKSPQDAEQIRRAWRMADELLSQRTDLDPRATMQSLCDSINVRNGNFG